MSNIRLGKVSISPRGDFALGTEYDRLDVVYNHERRSSFLSKQKHSNEPLDNKEYWMLLAYGAVGKSAYETAVEAGYLGTEAEFYTELYQVTDNIQKAKDATQAAHAAADRVDASIASADTATEAANTAAALANEKAELADGKATLANTAAENADAKAALTQMATEQADTATAAANAATEAATTATEAANTAATLANEKAELADSKATLANTAAENADAKATLADTKAGLAATAADRANTAASACEDVIAGDLNPAVELVLANNKDKPGGLASLNAAGKLTQMPTPADLGAATAADLTALTEQWSAFQPTAATIGSRPEGNDSLLWENVGTRPAHKIGTLWENIGAIDSDDRTGKLYAITVTIGPAAEDQISSNVVRGKVLFYYAPVMGYGQFQVEAVSEADIPVNTAISIDFNTVFTSQQALYQPMYSNPNNYLSIGLNGKLNVHIREALPANSDVKGSLSVVTNPANFQIPGSEFSFEEYEIPLIAGMETVKTQIQNLIATTTATTGDLTALQAVVGERPADKTGTLWENVGAGGGGDVTAAQLDEVKAKLAAAGDLTAIATPLQSQIGTKPNTKSKTLWEEIGTTTIKDKRGLWGLLGNWSLGSTTTVSSRLKTVYDKQIAQDNLIGTGFSAENTIAANIGERPAEVTGTLWEHIGGTSAAALSAAPEYVHQELIFGDAVPAEHVNVTTVNPSCHLTKYGNVCTCSGSFTIVQNADSALFTGYQDQRYPLSFSATDLPFSLSHLVYGTLSVASSAILPVDCRCFAENNSFTLETSFSGTDGPPVDVQWNFSITFVSENS